MGSIIDGIKAVLVDVQAEIDQLTESRKCLQALIDMQPAKPEQQPKRKYRKRRVGSTKSPGKTTERARKTRDETWVKIIARLLAGQEAPLKPREIMEALEGQGYKISGPTMYQVLSKGCADGAYVRTDVGYIIREDRP